MIVSINEYRLIVEIGEASIAPYQFTAERDPDFPKTLIGKFTTEKGINYIVRGWISESIFDFVCLRIVFESDFDLFEPEAETNHNNQYKVMSTVVAITKKFLQIEPTINEIKFNAKQKEERQGSNQRLMLYKSYVQKNFPDWTVEPGYFKSEIRMTKQENTI